jgi:DNA polymerase III sliding clamp (beta) subunit (PCNA family)
MEIKTADLRKALSIVKPGLANKEYIEQTTSFAFMEDRVVTYNDELCIMHPIEGLGLTGAIQAEALYALLGRIKEDMVKLDVEGNSLSLRAGKVKAEFFFEHTIKLPLDQDVATVGKWHKIPDNLLRFIKLAIGSCAKSMSFGELTGVHVTKEGIVESGDTYRYTKCNTSKLAIGSFVMPANCAEEIVKIDPAPTEISEGDGWIHFKNERGTQISSRVYADDFPDISKFFIMEGDAFTFPPEATEMIERAEIFAEQDHVADERIKIELSKGKMSMTAESDQGRFEEKLRVDYEGEPRRFDMIPYVLKDALVHKDTKCYIGENRVKFIGENWAYVGALMITE